MNLMVHSHPEKVEAKIFFDICLLFVAGSFSLSFPFSCGVNRPVNSAVFGAYYHVLCEFTCWQDCAGWYRRESTAVRIKSCRMSLPVVNSGSPCLQYYIHKQ